MSGAAALMASFSATTKAASPATRARVLAQPGFVLHSWPYKETSLIIEVFSRDYGRLVLVAKGAKRAHSQLRSVLQTFQPLQLAWTGRAEMRTLTAADWVGGMLPLEGEALLCGYYLNELLIKFVLRNEAHPHLFDAYVASLNALAHGQLAATVLRQFELVLLKQAGLLGKLDCCHADGVRLNPGLEYVVDPLHGIRPALAAEHLPVLLGKTLLDMEAADYADTATQNQSKLLMRFLLSFHLHGQILKTRQILIDLQKL